jgi:hypothetical protein
MKKKFVKENIEFLTKFFFFFDMESSKLINYSIYACVGNTLVPW